MPVEKKKKEEGKKEITVRTDLTFEGILKKALNTPLPESEKKKKGKKK